MMNDVTVQSMPESTTIDVAELRAELLYRIRLCLQVKDRGEIRCGRRSRARHVIDLERAGRVAEKQTLRALLRGDSRNKLRGDSGSRRIDRRNDCADRSGRGKGQRYTGGD